MQLLSQSVLGFCWVKDLTIFALGSNNLLLADLQFSHHCGVVAVDLAV